MTFGLTNLPFNLPSITSAILFSPNMSCSLLPLMLSSILPLSFNTEQFCLKVLFRVHIYIYMYSEHLWIGVKQFYNDDRDAFKFCKFSSKLPSKQRHFLWVLPTFLEHIFPKILRATACESPFSVYFNNNSSTENFWKFGNSLDVWNLSNALGALVVQTKLIIKVIAHNFEHIFAN